jgi:putative membrane protein
MEFVGLIVGIVIAALISGFVIWVVGKLGLGLEVTGFGPAFIAAIVIAVVAGLITWLLGLFGITIGGDFLGAIISLIVAAIVLMISGRIVPGLKVNGFVGALVAAISIGVVAWLVNWVLGLFGL